MQNKTFREPGSPAAVIVLLLAGLFSLVPAPAVRAFDLAVDVANGNSPYTLSSGTLSTGATTVGVSGVGVFTQTGGTHTVGDKLYIGANSTGNGSYTLSGAGTLSTNQSLVGYNGVGSFTQNGGTHTATGIVVVGYNVSGSGTYTLNLGTLSSTTTFVGLTGTGVFTQNGGAHNISGSLSLAQDTGSGGTYNLNGGILQAPKILGENGTSTFNFNGGTVQPTASTTAFLYNLTTAQVQAGGAKIDTVGLNITVLQSLLHDAGLGATADGGLTKSGTGALTLTAGSTFTGPTVINGGTLSASAGSSKALGNTASVTVNNGGTLLTPSANQINTSAPMTLNAVSGPGSGSTVAFNTAGTSQTLGALTLGSTSVIDLGSSGASILRFSASANSSWTGTLAIWNWSGTTAIGGGVDELFIGSNTAGLTPSQLAAIRFYSDAGTISLAAAGYAAGNNGEIVPGGALMATDTAVPEPSTWGMGCLWALAAVWCLRRRDGQRAEGAGEY